jgi:NADPH:quinone reductase-like Zn-dependent oxidoreductase
MAPRTHAALVAVGPRKPFEVHQRPTTTPQSDEILVKSSFTASTPLDLHRADGGLLVVPPQVLGAVTVGVVAEVGPDVTRLRPGDKVFGWAHEGNIQASHQEYITAPGWKFAKV